MAAVAKFFILVIFVMSVVEGRVLKLYSSDDELISDGIEKKALAVGEKNTDSCPSACNQQYGFLPCAENTAGYVFLIVVYHVLLLVGGRLVGSGSEVLFYFLGVGKFGGIIFRVLMALPSMMLMILSGIFGSKEEAQSQVSVGVGIYTGITVFSLTFQWGVCMIYGKIDLNEISNAPSGILDSKTCRLKEKIMILKDTGVKTDKKTSYTAGIMLLSLIPYVVLQLAFVFNTLSGKRIVTLIALIVSFLSLLSYFIYQIWSPWMQDRSLSYSNKVISLLDNNNDDKITKEEFMQGFEKWISEAKKSASDNNAFTNDLSKQDRSLGNSNKFMSLFDNNNNGKITEEESIQGFQKWDSGAEKSASDINFTAKELSAQLLNQFKVDKESNSQQMDRIMAKILGHAEGELLKSQSLITEKGEPNIERIKLLFKEFDTDGDKTISEHELKNIITRVNFRSYRLNEDDVLEFIFKEFDLDNNMLIDEEEFMIGMKKYMEKAIQAAHDTSVFEGAKIIEEFDRIVWNETRAQFGKWDLLISVSQVLLGITILTFLGKPLTANILQLSHAWGFPSFIISFFVVPLALNARLAIAAVLPASTKTEKAASWTFSEIYGGVIMNNMAGLTTLLAILYAKELAWDFTAEVVIILVVCGTIGTLAFFRTTYQLWTCILAFLLYPFSLGLFYFVQFSYSWN